VKCGDMEDWGVCTETGYRKWYVAEKIRAGRGRLEYLARGAGSGARYTS
jgi:hypothetical protein